MGVSLRTSRHFARELKFLHTGITSRGWGGEDEGGVGGRRTSDAFVKKTRSVERDAEMLANYGTKFRFAAG
jgi:hypothetical protein